MPKGDPIAEGIVHAAVLIRHARYAIALTGAGISTPSGIPDFRSTKSGLWTKYDPREVASARAFRERPAVFYAWVRPLFSKILEAVPNSAHVALAALELAGVLRAVITQNIDDLHQRAGSREVLELHGNLREAACTRCGHVVSLKSVWAEGWGMKDVPLCTRCGGVLKPDVVLFGDSLPTAVFNRAVEHARRADVMLVAGSSLGVVPVSQLPMWVHRRGGRLVVVNFEPTHVDRVADVVIRADVADVLPRIVEACVGGESESGG